MNSHEAEAEAKRRWGPKAFAYSYGVLFNVCGPDHFGCGSTYEKAFANAEPYATVKARNN